MTYGHDLHRQARIERARRMGEMIGTAVAAVVQFVSNAWRSSSSRGTNSKAPS